MWSPPTKVRITSEKSASWLLEATSLSRRLQLHCQTLRVELVEQGHLPSAALSQSECALIGKTPCLERKVVLYGDDVPWLLGRTLIPETTLTGKERDVAQLGEVPLGVWVFNHKHAWRDRLQLAQVIGDTSGQPLWARRSRLWVNDKPLLVSEVFLVDAPLYQE